MEPTIYAIIAAAVVLLFIFIFTSYVKAPPSYAFIISGLSREPRVLIGSGGFRIPFLERLDRVYLGQSPWISRPRRAFRPMTSST